MKWFIRAIILLLLGALITIPPILAGYGYLSRASSLPRAAEASAYYESAAKLLFWQPNLYEQAGLLERSDPLRAIHLLTVARQNGGLSSAGQLALGDAYQASSDMTKALAEWANLLQNKQEIPAASLRLANEYHARQQYKSEESILMAWLDADPNNAAANERLGLLLAARADARALSLLETAAAASPQAAEHLGQLISALQTPVEQTTYRLTLCGQALAQINEWPLAEQAFTLAVASNPQYASAWAWLGLARQKNGTPDALQALKNAQKLDARSAPLRAMFGTYWQQAGERQKARAEFQKAADLEPGNPAWWLALGGIDAQDNLPLALKSYTQAVNLDTQNAANWYALATFCMEKNAFVEEYGLPAALRAYALEPQNPLYMDMLGRAQMASGQSSAAEVMFSKALASGSQEQAAIFHFHLGLLYLQTNRGEQAKYEFEQTLQFDSLGPYGAQAKKLIERYFP